MMLALLAFGVGLGLGAVLASMAAAWLLARHPAFRSSAAPAPTVVRDASRGLIIVLPADVDELAAAYDALRHALATAPAGDARTLLLSRLRARLSAALATHTAPPASPTAPAPSRAGPSLPTESSREGA